MASDRRLPDCVIVSSDRFNDLKPYCDRLYEQDSKRWGDIMPWEFPQNADRKAEETFLRNNFDEAEIHMQGGSDGPGNGFRFLKHVWYSIAKYNWEIRVPATSNWWFQNNQDMLNDPKMKEWLLNKEVKPETFFNDNVKLYGEEFLKVVIHVIQCDLRALQQTKAASPDLVSRTNTTSGLVDEDHTLSTAAASKATCVTRSTFKSAAATEEVLPSSFTPALDSTSAFGPTAESTMLKPTAPAFVSPNVLSAQLHGRPDTGRDAIPYSFRGHAHGPPEQRVTFNRSARGGKRNSLDAPGSESVTVPLHPVIRTKKSTYVGWHPGTGHECLISPMQLHSPSFGPQHRAQDRIPPVLRGQQPWGPLQSGRYVENMSGTYDRPLDSSTAAIGSYRPTHVPLGNWSTSPFHARSNFQYNSRPFSHDFPNEDAGKSYYGHKLRRDSVATFDKKNGGTFRGRGRNGKQRGSVGQRSYFNIDQSSDHKSSQGSGTSSDFGVPQRDRKQSMSHYEMYRRISWRQHTHTENSPPEAGTSPSCGLEWGTSQMSHAEQPSTHLGQAMHHHRVPGPAHIGRHTLKVLSDSQVAHETSTEANKRSETGCTKHYIGARCDYATKLIAFNVPAGVSFGELSQYFHQFGPLARQSDTNLVQGLTRFTQQHKKNITDVFVTFSDVNGARRCLEQGGTPWGDIEVAKELWDHRYQPPSYHHRHAGFSDGGTGYGLPYHAQPAVTMSTVRQPSDRTCSDNTPRASELNSSTMLQDTPSGYNTSTTVDQHTLKGKKKHNKSKKKKSGVFEDVVVATSQHWLSKVNPLAPNCRITSTTNNKKLQEDISISASFVRSPPSENVKLWSEALERSKRDMMAESEAMALGLTDLTPSLIERVGLGTEPEASVPAGHTVKHDSDEQESDRSDLPAPPVSNSEDEHVDDSFQTASGSPHGERIAGLDGADQIEAAASKADNLDPSDVNPDFDTGEGKSSMQDKKPVQAPRADKKAPIPRTVLNPKFKGHFNLSPLKSRKAASDITDHITDASGTAFDESHQRQVSSLSEVPASTFVTAPSTPADSNPIPTSERTVKKKGPSQTESLSMFGAKKKSKKSKTKVSVSASVKKEHNPVTATKTSDSDARAASVPKAVNKADKDLDSIFHVYSEPPNRVEAEKREPITQLVNTAEGNTTKSPTQSPSILKKSLQICTGIFSKGLSAQPVSNARNDSATESGMIAMRVDISEDIITGDQTSGNILEVDGSDKATVLVDLVPSIYMCKAPNQARPTRFEMASADNAPQSNPSHEALPQDAEDDGSSGSQPSHSKYKRRESKKFETTLEGNTNANKIEPSHHSSSIAQQSTVYSSNANEAGFDGSSQTLQHSSDNSPARRVLSARGQSHYLGTSESKPVNCKHRRAVSCKNSDSSRSEEDSVTSFDRGSESVVSLMNESDQQLSGTTLHQLRGFCVGVQLAEPQILVFGSQQVGDMRTPNVEELRGLVPDQIGLGTTRERSPNVMDDDKDGSRIVDGDEDGVVSDDVMQSREKLRLYQEKEKDIAARNAAEKAASGADDAK